jgi:tripartite-type tricarboxylate transporter receptor subunit TctC
VSRFEHGALIAMLLAASSVCAQNYPSKPIRVVLPYPPGGGSDTIARPLLQKLAENLGQQVIVDNRGGAGGNIGMEYVAKSPPDGYTLLFALTAQFAINVSLYPKLPYDPVRDYVPISLLANAPYFMVVHPSVPAKSVAALIAFAQARPGQLAYSSSGNGSGAHLAGEMLRNLARIDITHVPYKGAGPALPDLLSGQVQLSFVTYIASGQHMKSGRLRALGVTTAKRTPVLPDLPAVAETVPGYDSAVWYGFAAPAGTPADVVAKLNSEVLRVLAAPDFRDRIALEAITAIGSTPDEFGVFIKSEIARWARVVKASGAKID